MSTVERKNTEHRVRVVESKLEKVEADLKIASSRLHRVGMALESARVQLGLDEWPEGLTDLDARLDWLADEVYGADDE
jgi:hypothetical protein